MSSSTTTPTGLKARPVVRPRAGQVLVMVFRDDGIAVAE
jgi:hypothetical protein